MTAQNPPPLAQTDPLEMRFRAIERACAPHGGLTRADELLFALRACTQQPLSWMARRIAAREILCFAHREQLWIPRFQFLAAAGQDASFELRPVVARVIQEMKGSYGDWELLSWFVDGHGRLGGRRPIDLLDSQAMAVTAAALIDAAALRAPHADLSAPQHSQSSNGK